MVRFTLLAVALMLVPGKSAARSQDSEETKRLKDRIELLEAKLKIAEMENELLHKELASQKKDDGSKPMADDGFQVGAKFTGTQTRSWIANGKREVIGGDVEFEVTKRSGKEFTAEWWGENRKNGVQVEGTIENNILKATSTKNLTSDKTNAIGIYVFTGRLDKGVLTGTVTKKSDTTYKGDVKLKLKKE